MTLKQVLIIITIPFLISSCTNHSLDGLYISENEQVKAAWLVNGNTLSTFMPITGVLSLRCKQSKNQLEIPSNGWIAQYEDGYLHISHLQLKKHSNKTNYSEEEIWSLLQ